ncbi:hypothetical protein HID58_071675 [Brassica napus]|uniref:Polygalacturonase n=1 Tax=Brassica napus TaxID=3708 RepID=A0ABQ7Z2D2_BRANA|nr:hypothetical protein HID58_071675 [Brassica napus]
MKRSFLLWYVLLVQAFFYGAWYSVGGSLHCEYSNSVILHRPHSVSITEFGAVGDGVTLNTKAFQNALFYLNSFSDKGGAKLFVPAGQWLTGSFDLISHLTSENWPVVDPLPSYGRGRELPGRRHRSLIYGQNLTDVVITGENGTIDGQGSVWWDWFRNGELNYTRPHIVELINTTVSIKSGWDEYGISYARPSSKIKINRVTGQTTSSSGIAIGSEMSGGVSDIYIKDLHLFNSNTGIRIKTSPGRGGYVRNVHVSNVKFHNVQKAIRFTGKYGEHPDENFDPKALPVIEKITFENVNGEGIGVAGLLEGIEGDEFKNICFLNVTLIVKKNSKKAPWKCSHVRGYSQWVSPEITCDSFGENIFPEHSSDCFGLSENDLEKSSGLSRSPWLLSW